MRQTGHIWLFFVLLLSSTGIAHAQSQNALFIKTDELMLQIDLASSSKKIDSILKLGGLANSSASKILNHDYKALKSDGWNVSPVENNLLVLVRPLANVRNNPQNAPFKITTRMHEFDANNGYPVNVKWGVNQFEKTTVYELSSGLTRFILPGFTGARRAFLSGSFNQWSTLKGAMKKTEGGWLLDVPLQAGAYEYKFIVDGRWMTDPNNQQNINDGGGNTNSVYFKYNYTLKLTGHQSAQQVTVEGDFNKWGQNELRLNKTTEGWERQLYLSDGKHAYHFIVDGKRIIDPANTDQVKVKNGDVNSVVNLGKETIFKLTGYTDAKRVSVAGSFNKWQPNEYNLSKTENGWTLQTTLPPGNYGYRIIVDGKWMEDPANPHRVKENGHFNSFLAVNPNYTFRLKGYPDAKSIVLTGTFNNWEPNGYSMVHTGNEWLINFYLKPGKYLYKFRVDGDWIIDPGNRLWEQNAEHTGNSVLWIE